VTVVHPEQLFQQAEKLIEPPPAGPALQVSLRRAISSAYYGVFHFILTAVSDAFVGSSFRTKPRYALVYRSVDHGTLRSLCAEVAKPTPSARYRPYVPSSGFGPDLKLFAEVVADLQSKRHQADYDPLQRFQMRDARLAIETGRVAIARFKAAPEDSRKLFLTLLLCPPR